MPGNPSTRWLLILLLLAGCDAGRAAEKTEQRPMISSAALDPAKVQGSLGQPLGKLITVAGRIRAGDPRSKADQDKILLEVSQVDGKVLPKPVTIGLGFFGFTGLSAPKPGTAVKYQGYETGSFEGIPSESFKVMPAVASEEFHFESLFQVCKAEK